MHRRAHVNNVIELNDSNIEEVLNNQAPSWITFGAEWCRPCQLFSPILETVAASYVGKVNTYHVDVDAAPGASEKFCIRAVPTHVLFKNGSEVKRYQGSMFKQKLLDAYKELVEL